MTEPKVSTKSPGRLCAVCREPVTAHTKRPLSAPERVLIMNTARSRQDANARIRSAQRVCPLVAIKTVEGAPQRWTPKRLADAGLVA